MTHAQCCCGALALTLPEQPIMAVACHCLDCQRRTGAPFGVGAFYPADAVSVSGPARQFTRNGESGGKVHTYFCPNCGSSVYWTAEKLPSMIAVATGALADPTIPAPAKSIFERSKHGWIEFGEAVEHFEQGIAAKGPK